MTRRISLERSRQLIRERNAVHTMLGKPDVWIWPMSGHRTIAEIEAGKPRTFSLNSP